MKYIYKTTNQINGRIYIGQHSIPDEKDINNDLYLGSGVALKRAIKKYGKENFRREILHVCFSNEYLDYLEIIEIKKYREILGNKNIYNIENGGRFQKEILTKDEKIKRFFQRKYIPRKCYRKSNKQIHIKHVDYPVDNILKEISSQGQGRDMKDKKIGDYVLVTNHNNNDSRDPWYISHITKIINSIHGICWNVEGSDIFWRYAFKISEEQIRELKNQIIAGVIHGRYAEHFYKHSLNNKIRI